VLVNQKYESTPKNPLAKKALTRMPVGDDMSFPDFDSLQSLDLYNIV